MYDNPFYEYGIPILLAAIVITTVFSICWIEYTVTWRQERKARKKRQKAAKAKRQQAAA